MFSLWKNRNKNEVMRKVNINKLFKATNLNTTDNYKIVYIETKTSL